VPTKLYPPPDASSLVATKLAPTKLAPPLNPASLPLQSVGAQATPDIPLEPPIKVNPVAGRGKNPSLDMSRGKPGFRDKPHLDLPNPKPLTALPANQEPIRTLTHEEMSLGAMSEANKRIAQGIKGLAKPGGPPAASWGRVFQPFKKPIKAVGKGALFGLGVAGASHLLSRLLSSQPSSPSVASQMKEAAFGADKIKNVLKILGLNIGEQSQLMANKLYTKSLKEYLKRGPRRLAGEDVSFAWPRLLSRTADPLDRFGTFVRKYPTEVGGATVGAGALGTGGALYGMFGGEKKGGWGTAIGSLFSPFGGGVGGAIDAPSGQRAAGFGHGFLRGLGGATGAGAGLAAALPLALHLHPKYKGLANLVALLGLGGGAYGGYKLTGKMTGPAPGDEKRAAIAGPSAAEILHLMPEVALHGAIHAPLFGSLTGAYKAPWGHKWEGAGRGAVEDTGMLGGVLGGGYGGTRMMPAWERLLEHLRPGILKGRGSLLRYLPTAIGGLGGGWAGGEATRGLTNMAFGHPSWEPPKMASFHLRPLLMGRS
jgi:hypothetical protein